MIDVDSTYNPDSGMTLDEHRQTELAKITQPGFGSRAKRVTPKQVTPEPTQPAADNAADAND